MGGGGRRDKKKYTSQELLAGVDFKKAFPCMVPITKIGSLIKVLHSTHKCSGLADVWIFNTVNRQLSVIRKRFNCY